MSAKAGLVGLAIAVMCGFLPPSAGATGFSGPARITAEPGFTGSPYPATLPVSGLSGHITDLNVAVRGIQAPEGDALAMLLQAPGGQSLILLDGGPSQIFCADLTLDDSAPSQIPIDADLASSCVGQYRFKPTDYYAGDEFPAPGPGTNYGNPGPDGGGNATLASTFNGTDPNGTWKLFALNFGTTNPAYIGGPWELELSGFEGFSIGKPAIPRSLKKVILPVNFQGPGRALIDDATHPSYRASGKRQRKLKPPGTLLTPEANFFIRSAGTYQLVAFPSSKARRILRRRGKVTLPIRVTFGTSAPGTQTSRRIDVTLRKRRKG